MIDKKIIQKAEYCLNCVNKPCSNKGCPLENNIPEIIKLVKDKKIEEAYKILSKTTVLSSICGRVCPHKKQCEGSCIRGIKGEAVSIGDIESYVGDMAIKNEYNLYKDIKKKDKNLNSKLSNLKVAIIGGGPSGLTCAAFLAKEGVKVTIYEKYDYLGGLLMHGIPEFRLSKEIVKQTINKILNLGIKVKYNKELNKDFTLSDLEEKYDAIFLSIGANTSLKARIKGEDIEGVYGANELLEYNKHPDYNGKEVIVYGGGNVAIDIARTIKRQGAKNVKIVYRRSRKEMPSEDKEIKMAEIEGIEFLYQNNILKIFSNKENKVEKVELIKTKLVQKDGETRLSPVNIEKSNYEIRTDYVVMAIGSKPQEFVCDLGLELNRWGYVKVDNEGRTSNKKIFAGGDIVGNNSTIAWAARSGRDAAENIIKLNR